MLEAGRCTLCARDAGGMHRMLLCMLEAVESEVCSLEALEVLEVLRRVRLCILEVLRRVRLCIIYAGGAATCAALYAGGRGGELCLLEVLNVTRCMLLCMLEAVDGGLGLGILNFTLWCIVFAL